VKTWHAGFLAFAYAACAGEAGPGPGVAIDVAALELPGVTDASWRLTVSAAGATVWTRDLSSRGYGDGGGSLSYVGPCDADAGTNTVTVELLALYRGAAGDVVVDAASYDNPGPISRDVTCLADRDVPVTFDVTLVRAATQGFFDVTITFDDIFCAAKLDCEDPDGDPIALLSDSAGARRPTVVLGFACTADTAADDTVLYLDDVVLSCNGGANTATVDPTAGPGNLGPGTGITQDAATLFGAAVYRGREDLGGVGKLYWNLALGLELGTAPAQGCTLTTAGTAASGPLPGAATPAGTTYPYVSWSVPLTSGAGALTCTQHPVDGDNGVAITYADPDAPVSFAGTFDPHGDTVTLTGARTAADPGRWSDGTLATSCEAYRRPANSSYVYADAAGGDGVYRIQPEGEPAQLAACDMTTDFGGWTVFFAGLNGSPNVFDHFDAGYYSGVCTDPSSRCLRRIPANVPESGLAIAAKVHEHVVELQMNADLYAWATSGARANWVTLTDTVVLTGAPAVIPNALWTGEIANPDNTSFILGLFDDQVNVFMSSYDYGTSWNRANGAPDTSSPIRLLYREGGIPVVSGAYESCQAALAAGHASDGVQLLQTAGTRARYAYCDQTHDGGGWTALYSGKNGSGEVFDRYDAVAHHGVCTDPATRCLRRPPVALDPATTELAVSCGDAMVAFDLTANIASWLSDGTQHGWQSIANVRDIGDEAVVNPPIELWTGASGASNMSWILGIDGSFGATFANSYNNGSTWDYCNSGPNAAQPVRIFYRTAP